jgi:predicted O-methyltransferase YrrM
MAAFRRLARQTPVTLSLSPATADRTRFSPDDLPEGEWADVAGRVKELGITDDADGVNPGDRRALYYLIRKLKPQRVLEVGTHIGASTVHIALALARNSDTGNRFVTVDIQDVNDPVRKPWEGHGAMLSPRQALEQVGIGSLVRFVHAPSLAFLAEDSESYDFVFLDGDHSPATAYQEIPAALRRLRPGGHVLLHDYFPDGRPLWPDGAVIVGPWLATERLRREGADFAAMPLGHLPWPTKLGTTVTSLALLARTATPERS